MIWSPLLKSSNRVSHQLIHSTDWLPTLTHLAGVRLPQRSSLDGLNMWETLSRQLTSPRREIVHNIDPIYPYTSYMSGKWKYVKGTVNPTQDTWLGDIPTTENPQADTYTTDLLYASEAWQVLSKYGKRKLKKRDILRLRDQATMVCLKEQQNNTVIDCDPLAVPCLFNIAADPCERNNLAEQLPNVVQMVEQSLAKARLKVVDPLNKPYDPRADPGLNGFQWTYWLDLLKQRDNEI